MRALSRHLTRVCLMALLVQATPAATGEKEWGKSLRAWRKMQHQAAIEFLDAGIGKCEKKADIKENNYNLLFLQRALFRLYMGETQKAQDDLWVAYAHSDVDKSGALKTKEFLFADAHNQYKLQRREECYLLHSATYRGRSWGFRGLTSC